MAQVVAGNAVITANLVETLTAGIASGNIPAAVSFPQTFANGTGAGNIQRLWTKTHTAAISTPDTWVLSGLTDDLGRTIPFAKVRVIICVNQGTADLLLGAAGTNPWAALFGTTSDRLRVPAGGAVAIIAPGTAGLGVTASSSDQLKVDPGASAILYQLIFAGE